MLASPKVPRRDWERGAEGGTGPLLSRSALYTMDADTPADLPLFTKLYTLAQVLGILSVVLVGVWVGIFRGGFGWTASPDLQFNWHPFLMVLGLVLLYANGALIYRGFRSERKRKLKVVHAVVMVGALVCAVVGLVAVFAFHNTKKFANMHSLHSWIGLATVVLFACQWLAGLLTFLFPGLRSSLRAAYLPIHQFFGMFIFAGAVTSSLIGLSEKATAVSVNAGVMTPSENVLVNVTGLCVAVFAGLVTYLLSQPKFRRHTTEDEVLLTDTVLE
ncbi:transmembrane ascorbate-dependent reductase CYB561-like [Portunus trituberculatus]|uniref:transmembrane ascorbate-dependent reductase CYB561-like n=1 Tax=Portunus trituberculatus TaxID=210409 RepID=UPI001E1CDB91|nr:transmembrane ascorbate-dependent reductase CYB561-like [Portunus trituberculatus]